MPWILIPLLWLLCFDPGGIGAIDMDLTILMVPMAALMAVRFGKSGLYAVVIGGLPLPVGIQFGVFGFPPDPATYAVAVWLAALLAHERPVSTWLPAQHLSPAFVAAFAFLPLRLSSPDLVMDNGAELHFDLDLLPVFYFFLFLLGLSRTSSRLAIGAVLIAGAAGIAFEVFGWWMPETLPFDGPFSFGLDHPLEVMTALLSFAIARHMRRAKSGEPRLASDDRIGRLLLTGSLALWAAYELCILPGQPQWLAQIQQRGLLDEDIAIPLACLMAGYRLRSYGVALAYGWWMVILVATNLILADFDPASILLWITVATPFAIVAFALIGIVARDRLDGIKTMPPVGGWTVYCLLLCVTLPAYFDLSRWQGIVALCVAFSVAIALGVLGQRLRRLARQLRMLTPVRALLGAIALVLLAGTILSNLQLVFGMVTTAGAAVQEVLEVMRRQRMWEADNTFLVVIALLFYLIILSSAVVELLKAVPAIRTDIPKLLRVIRLVRHGGFAAVRVSAGRSASAAPDGATEQETAGREVTMWHRSARIAGWLRNVLAVVLVVTIAEFVAQILWRL